MALLRLAALQQVLGVHFKDPPLLEQALVHSSYVNENPGVAAGSNERLEFLGDAVLSIVLSQKIYHDFPDAAEGEMTRLRSILVRCGTLSSVAKGIGLGDYLYLGKGEEASGGRQKSTNLAGALEAVMAAVFLDQGWQTTVDFVQRLFDNELVKLTGKIIGFDYKSKLQHIVQSSMQMTPVYRITESAGPAHDRTFTAEVRVGDNMLGRGSGKSKKLAEAEAARAALAQLNHFTR